MSNEIFNSIFQAHTSQHVVKLIYLNASAWHFKMNCEWCECYVEIFYWGPIERSKIISNSKMCDIYGVYEPKFKENWKRQKDRNVWKTQKYWGKT